jgi:voltage-dependent anion channel protein 2
MPLPPFLTPPAGKKIVCFPPPGLKLDLNTVLNPAVNSKSATVTAVYKQPALHTRALIDLFSGPVFTADAVLG